MLIRRALSWLGFSGLHVTEGSQNPNPDRYSADTPVPVDFERAMQLSAAWACTRLLTETISCLPIQFYQVNGTEKVPDTQSDVAQLFDGKVNSYQTPVEFMETYVLNLVSFGNAYAVKQYLGNRLVALLPLMSSQVETRLLKDGTIVHYHYNDEGVAAYSADSIWHSKIFGNGVVGMSPMGFARNTLGVALAGESRVSKIFQNGGKPTGVLMIDKVLKPEQRDQIRREFQDLRDGNNDRLAVLEAGMQYQQVSMSPQDIQLLESRRFQIEDICRFYGVPSVLVNDTVNSTTWGSGIHEIVQGFHKLNLSPYLTRMEQGMKYGLFSAGQRRTHGVRFDQDALLRGDLQNRMEAYRRSINAGVFTPNEVRRREGYQSLPGGDRLLVNGNMIPVDQAGEQPARGGSTEDGRDAIQDD